MKKFVSWRRVSTKRQGSSGLGLEAQKEIIRYFVEREGGEWIGDFKECYTGTDLNGCTELKKAIALSKENEAVLIIAKTDRFRNTIEALQVYDDMGDGNIMFCDLPHTDKFTLTLFFALAEREALLVSIRTRQALAAKKARGEALGGGTDAWRTSYNNKTNEQKHKEGMERGKTKNMRHLESREVQAFLKVLRNVFPDACVGDASQWDWDKINTKEENRVRILSMMKDYKELDSTLFVKWDFDVDDILERPLMVRLAGYIASLRKSVRIANDFKTKE
jgi:Site-specific recombinases, DNA invertase Pin homologs